MEVGAGLRNRIKDEEIGYPKEENSGSPMRDKAFNFVVKRYQKFGHPWKKSDQKVWHGFIYSVTQYFSIIIFFAVIGFLLYKTDELFGFERAILLALLMLMVRVNVLIKQMVQLNRKF